VPHLSAKTAVEHKRTKEKSVSAAARGSPGMNASAHLPLRLQIATSDELKTPIIGLGDAESDDETRRSPNHCSSRLSTRYRWLPPRSHCNSSILHAAAVTASTNGNASSARRMSRLLISMGDAIPMSRQHSMAAAFCVMLARTHGEMPPRPALSQSAACAWSKRMKSLQP
jgi:hypothetical protein